MAPVSNDELGRLIHAKAKLAEAGRLLRQVLGEKSRLYARAQSLHTSLLNEIQAQESRRRRAERDEEE